MAQEIKQLVEMLFVANKKIDNFEFAEDLMCGRINELEQAKVFGNKELADYIVSNTPPSGKITAIKAFRRITGADLRPSMEAIEEAQHRVATQ